MLKSLLAVVLIAAAGFGGFKYGKTVGVKSVPRVMVMDPATGNPVMLVAPDGSIIFVASPTGYEPGIYAGHSKDNKKILILPPSLLGAATDPGPQQNQTKHTEPEQSHGERLDRASI